MADTKRVTLIDVERLIDNLGQTGLKHPPATVTDEPGELTIVADLSPETAPTPALAAHHPTWRNLDWTGAGTLLVTGMGLSGVTWLLGTKIVPGIIAFLHLVATLMATVVTTGLALLLLLGMVSIAYRIVKTPTRVRPVRQSTISTPVRKVSLTVKPVAHTAPRTAAATQPVVTPVRVKAKAPKRAPATSPKPAPVAHLVGRRGAACGAKVPRGENARRSDPKCSVCADAAGTVIVSDDGTVTHYPFV